MMFTLVTRPWARSLILYDVSLFPSEFRMFGTSEPVRNQFLAGREYWPVLFQEEFE